MKALGWVLLVIGLLLMVVTPLFFVLPVPGLFSLMFMRPQLMTIFPIIGLIILIIGIIFLASNQPKLSEKRMEIIDRQFPCPVCKKDVFLWSKVPSAIVRLRVGLGQPTFARVCRNCGNVQQFTKTD